MTRSTDPRSAAGDLPSFLGASESEAREMDAAPARTGCGPADEQDPAYDEYDGDEVYDDEAAYEQEPAYGDSHPDDATAPTAPATPRRDDGAPTAAGGLAAVATGAALTLAGVAQLVVPTLAALPPAGWTPQLSLTLGAVALALGLTQRRVGLVHQRLDRDERQRAARDAALDDALEQLLECSARDGAGDGSQAEQALLALQRQDQKINNLTKATKMYGKPLMEIAAQGAEVAGQVAQVQATVDGLAEKTASGGAPTDSTELTARLDALGAAVAALQEQARADGDDLKQAVDAVRRQQADTSSDDQLQVRLAEATTRIGQGIDQLRDRDVAGIEASVRDIQREVASLAGAVAALQPGAAPTERAAQPE
ncbi:MAG: hypothetical protein ACON4Z_15880, partial [Planctomycetota bacterium]